ncbi:MAG TPA: CinA family nicotinamide mononucleotide deamidase-related protein [Pelolinea sp.]|nr:CinA family nicotinamide mononucleotide deamidase-related protein [Pelolinea sp.]
MPIAEIIAIGTELLLGQTQDTNTAYIAQTLNASGIDIFRASMIGDNEKRIAESIKESLKRAQIIITTGGLGPTVDDPTRSAIALAFNRSVEYHPELWEEIQNRFMSYGRNPSENNKRQAYLPADAIVIHNPVGTAPAFYIEQGENIIFSLPGVPSEMKTLLHDDVIPIILNKFQLKSVIVTRVIHTAGIGESSVDELVSDLETLSNPTVGLAAHPGQVDIRITAKASDREEAMKLIDPIEIQVENLLGYHIYGADDTTLIEVVINLIGKYQINLVILFQKGQQEIANHLAEQLYIKNDELILMKEELSELLESFTKENNQPDNAILVLQDQTASGHGVDLMCKIINNDYQKSLYFGGHPSLYPQWASNQILNFLRETIMKEKGGK